MWDIPLHQPINFFPRGTTQQDVMDYIDQALTQLKNTKGPHFPQNGSSELVNIQGKQFMIGSDLGNNIKNGSYPPTANIIGQFYPVKDYGAVTLEPVDLKIINTVLQ